MKRVGNIYSDVCDLDNLRVAHKNARKGKSFYEEVKMVDADPDKYLLAIQDSLKNKTFKTSEYSVFTKKEGKKEQIYL